MALYIPARRHHSLRLTLTAPGHSWFYTRIWLLLILCRQATHALTAELPTSKRCTPKYPDLPRPDTRGSCPSPQNTGPYCDSSPILE
ncbi:hypothetical protein E2C01_096737 [Portunus trituberculatus]|uniref:Uncharacterized protein n=1 Tax=Portunus trituberculatus TaxID=210409 RepID=A0A5B7K821_PORTR|nr:hypothetical protein [Portunus trituberculatus]